MFTAGHCSLPFFTLHKVCNEQCPAVCNAMVKFAVHTVTISIYLDFLSWEHDNLIRWLCVLAHESVSPHLANPVWCLTYIGFNKIVFGTDTLLDVYLDQVTIFITRALGRPRLHGALLPRDFTCGYIDIGQS
jgi:hypothetical protein